MNDELIYIDTNVIIDFLLGRDSSAFKLLLRTISCEFHIIISSLVIKELHYQGFDDEMTNLFSLLKNVHKLTILEVFESDHVVAGGLLKQYPTHYSDALHKTIAKRSNVRYLVTKNIRDFSCFTDIDVVKPDDI